MHIANPYNNNFNHSCLALLTHSSFDAFMDIGLVCV